MLQGGAIWCEVVQVERGGARRREAVGGGARRCEVVPGGPKWYQVM